MGRLPYSLISVRPILDILQAHQKGGRGGDLKVCSGTDPKCATHPVRHSASLLPIAQLQCREIYLKYFYEDKMRAEVKQCELTPINGP